MNVSRQNLYITQNNNYDFWDGYLVGTARDGFCIKTVRVTNIQEEEYCRTGYVRMGGLRLHVYQLHPDSYWEISDDQPKI